jgi:glycosyltransferase involved in cell wall biosynthesis
VVYNAPLAWPEASSRLDIRRESGVTARDTLLVYSGALSAARGVDTIVRALVRLPDVHAAVVAVPYPHRMAPELSRLARAEGVENRLHFVPPVPSHEVPAYLSGADIAVSPIFGDSPSYDMALPNKLFEYVHAGLPVVTSDIAAMAQFVSEHGLGEVFQAGDPNRLAEAVTRLEGHRAVVDTTEIRRTFSWQCQERALVAVYEELVDGLRPQTAPWEPADLHVEWSKVGRA